MILSVIIPNFNSGSLLEISVRRLFQFPSANSFEVLVMDNCSIDGSTDFIIGNQFPEVRLISQNDGGVYYAMNEGIRRSKGDWLYFLGAGDCFFPELLDESVFQTNADFIYADVDQSPSSLKGKVSLSEILFENICHQGIFYRRSAITNLGGYDPRYRYLADHILNIRLFFDPKIKKIHLPLTIASYLGGGISSTKKDEFFRKNKKKHILRELLRNPGFSRGLTVANYFWKVGSIHLTTALSRYSRSSHLERREPVPKK
ncbi:glycosyltransferase [Algoriphagus lacus]|uniref:glycosyltransferase n=1 Tax=Algoriphagus lacus TaxID=2056311 RepID=UPI001313EE36|nr:glycosyltransferase [Algoriphagus lacus]